HGADKDIGEPVAIHVGRSHVDSPEEAHVRIGEERDDIRVGGTVEDLDMAVGPGTHNDVGQAIAVDISGRHCHSTREAREGDEAADQRPGGTVEDLDVSVDPGAGDDVGDAVPVDVAGRYGDAPAKAGVRRQVAEQLPGDGVTDLDEASVARPGADHKVVPHWFWLGFGATDPGG